MLVTEDVTGAALALMHRVVAQAGGAQVALALSGGSTPLDMFARLGSPAERDRWPWDRMILFWGDERPVPADHPDSNYGAARRLWLDPLGRAAPTAYPWPTQLDPGDAAARYAKTLTEVLGPRPVFDLVFLGVGPEGHTASLFPQSPALTAREWTAAPYVASKSSARLTLTPRVFNLSRRVAFLLQGREKREIVRRAFADPAAGLPVQAIAPTADPWWIVDPAAAADLPAFPPSDPL